jgi:hypothetical protein
MPPGVPEERVAALRKAFEEMIRDPEFLAETHKSNMYLRTATGPEMEKMVSDVVTAPKEVVARLTQLMEAKGGGHCEDYTRADLCRKPRAARTGGGG